MEKVVNYFLLYHIRKMQFGRGKVLLDRIRKIFTLKIGEEGGEKVLLDRIRKLWKIIFTHAIKQNFSLLYFYVENRGRLRVEEKKFCLIAYVNYGKLWKMIFTLKIGGGGG